MIVQYILIMPESPYLSANLKHATGARLRTVVHELALARGSRVTTSDAVDALMDLAAKHPAELEDLIKAKP